MTACRRHSAVAGMLHLSGLNFPLGRINDPATPIANAQKVVYDYMQAIRPGKKIVFLGLKHDIHDRVEIVRAADIAGGYCSVPADAIIVPHEDNIAIAVFVGDCIAMRMVGSNHRALVHYGWQEARDGVAVNFRHVWSRLGEHLFHEPTTGLCIGRDDLSLNGDALLGLHAAGLDNCLHDQRGSNLPIRWAVSSWYSREELAGKWWDTIKLGFDLPCALNDQLFPDAQPVEGHIIESYIRSMHGNTVTDLSHASDRRTKAAGTKSHRDCYVVM